MQVHLNLEVTSRKLLVGILWNFLDAKDFKVTPNSYLSFSSFLPFFNFFFLPSFFSLSFIPFLPLFLF